MTRGSRRMCVVLLFHHLAAHTQQYSGSLACTVRSNLDRPEVAWNELYMYIMVRPACEFILAQCGAEMGERKEKENQALWLGATSNSIATTMHWFFRITANCSYSKMLQQQMPNQIWLSALGENSCFDFSIYLRKLFGQTFASLCVDTWPVFSLLLLSLTNNNHADQCQTALF